MNKTLKLKVSFMRNNGEFALRVETFTFKKQKDCKMETFVGDF